jgi:glycosyltransferase involved in cell wall biosynthesis
MIVHAYYPLGETRVERQAVALAARNFDVDVFSLRKSGEPGFENIEGVNVFRVPLKRYKSGGLLTQLFEYIFFFVLVFFRISWKSLTQRYEVVQVHNLPDFLVFSAIIPKLMGSGIILDLHDLMPEFYASRFNNKFDSLPVRIVAWQEKISCWFADHVITVTDLWKDKLISRGVPPGKVSVVMNVADHNFFSREVSREKPGDTNGTFKLIYHGNLTYRYGIDLAIRAVDQLRHKIPEISLTIHGGGDYRDDLERLVHTLELGDHVHFSRQFMDVSELPEFIAQADLGVVPYRQDIFTDEILPTKLMEYTALGLPVVVARNSAVMAYFDDSMVQYFQPGDVDELVNCIYTLYSDQILRESMVANSSKFTQTYNWQNISENYVSLVKRVGAGD